MVDIGTAKSLAREYAIFGSVAIANGRVYLQTASGMFCIGNGSSQETAEAPMESPKEEPIDPANPPPVAHVQVRPADLVLRPGQSAKFTAWAFDEKGRSLGQVNANWSLGQLALPAAPNSPSTQPTLVGNLKGAISTGGEFTAAPGAHQGGAIVATVGTIHGQARVRVLPPLPWRFDFESNPLDKPPLTWLGAGGKFSVVADGTNKSLVKLTDFDLYYRARTNFGTADMANYTLQADVKVGQKVIAGERQMPDSGIINSRYVLELLGNHQRLQSHVWPPTLPYSLNKTIPYEWQADKWYTMKLQVQQSSGKAIARGKVWPKGESEPRQWTIELEDEMPNRCGNPGLFGHSLVGAAKSLIYFDNILVTANESN